MVADDVTKEGTSDGVHIPASQWDQCHHLTKTVHDHHDSVVAAIFRLVHDKVDVDLLLRGLWDWQWLVQTGQLTCVGLVALTNVTALTVPTYVIPHACPVVLLSNHWVSAVHTKMTTHIMELVQYCWRQSLWYKQTPLAGQKLAQSVALVNVASTAYNTDGTICTCKLSAMSSGAKLASGLPHIVPMVCGHLFEHAWQ